jgi:TonB family protein
MGQPGFVGRICALLLLAAAAAPSAWPQAANKSGPLAYFARSDAPPPAERPRRDGLWPDRDDYSAFPDEADLGRWTTQANAGRAQAAINAGDNLMFTNTPARSACAAAIRWYRKAEDLGSEFAAGRLAAAYSDDACPERDLATAVMWWRKAAERGSFAAAAILSQRLHEPGSPLHDPVLALAYAEVAADNPETWKDEAERPADPAALAADLTPQQLADARHIAADTRTALHARQAAFRAEPARDILFGRESAGGGIIVVAIDDLRECERNLVGNCRGVRQLAYVDFTNNTDELLRCSVSLRTTDGNTNAPLTLERETLVTPNAGRFLRLGRIAGTPDEDAIRAHCEPVPGFAAAAAGGTCVAQPTAQFALDSIYPAKALAAGVEGRVALYVVTNEREGPPLFAEVMQTSGSALLDGAALEAARKMRYRSGCDAGYRPFAIEFKLAQ